MKFSLSITTLVASLLLATNAEARWQPTPNSDLTWDYLLGASDSVINASKAKVVTIDIDEGPKFVPILHGRGQKVICYFSGGTIQNKKSDYPEYKKAGVELSEKSSWGNHYIDIRKKDKLQPLIRKRMVRARDYGCDAVEVDSLGLYVHHIRDYTKEDTITFGKWLAETAHSVGISIGLKNVAGCSEALEQYFDFAVVESCADSRNVCDYYKKFTNNNKAVFMVHYGNRGYKLSGSSLEKLIREAGNRGFTCVISDHQNLKKNSHNYDCNNGRLKGSSGSLPKITPEKTTTIKKTTTVKAPAQNKPTVVPKPVIPLPGKSGSGVSKNVPTNTSKTLPGNPAKSLTPGVQATPAKNVPGAQNVPGVPGAKNIPGIQGAQGAQNVTGVPGAQNATKQPNLSNLTAGNSTNKGVPKEVGKTEEESSNVGSAVAIVAVGVGATAAVAGFVFLKKNKKFTSNKFSY
ncbi:glycoside hydrolase family 114 protein [Piromyces sp. E2]|nr:glycoside hydrolase family 114 protein [Piromyces sp. E2]|eukprot:OUM60984.1 glycoside hydrolase family 114 protein [Piromyces sp. E2]